jgi:hypothetical protein
VKVQINQLEATVARLMTTFDHHNAVDAWHFGGERTSNAGRFRAERPKWPSFISIMQP